MFILFSQFVYDDANAPHFSNHSNWNARWGSSTHPKTKNPPTFQPTFSSVEKIVNELLCILCLPSMPQVVILQKEAPKIRLIDVDITTNRVNLNNVTPTTNYEYSWTLDIAIWEVFVFTKLSVSRFFIKCCNSFANFIPKICKKNCYDNGLDLKILWLLYDKTQK